MNEPFSPGTRVQVVEPLPTAEWDAVLHRTYIVEQYVGTPPLLILGEKSEPFYFLTIDKEASDGLAWTAPAWALISLEEQT